MDVDERQSDAEPALLPLRGLAFILDWAIVLVLSFFVAGGADVGVATRLPILLVVASIYEVGFTVALGTTPGKMAMRMRITDEQGKRLEPDKAVLRSVVLLIGIFVLFIGFAISLVLALGDAKHRALHYRLAGSIVVRA
jgi:uncharacterized RDD family membrane protein YckC